MYVDHMICMDSHVTKLYVCIGTSCSLYALINKLCYHYAISNVKCNTTDTTCVELLHKTFVVLTVSISFKTTRLIITVIIDILTVIITNN